jgi:hypothetical protein
MQVQVGEDRLGQRVTFQPRHQARVRGVDDPDSFADRQVRKFDLAALEIKSLKLAHGL